jgi:hypothetical protein
VWGCGLDSCHSGGGGGGQGSCDHCYEPSESIKGEKYLDQLLKKTDEEETLHRGADTPQQALLLSRPVGLTYKTACTFR